MRGFHPAGVGSGEPGRVEAREGRRRPSPQIGGKRLAAEFCGLEGGLDWKGETVLLECFFHGAIDIGVLVSLGAVNEGGCRGMGSNGIADLDFGYASLERVGGISQVGLVPFAVRCIFVGEVGIVEEFRFGPGVFLIANACPG